MDDASKQEDEHIIKHKCVRKKQRRMKEKIDNQFSKFFRKISPSLTTKPYQTKPLHYSQTVYLTNICSSNKNGLKTPQKSYFSNLDPNNENSSPRSIYQPTDPYNVLNLILKLNIPNTFESIYWDFAGRLNDPFLFLQAFDLLFSQENEMLMTFSFNGDFYDLFLDHYLSLIDISPISYRYRSMNQMRLTIINISVNMLISQWEFIPSNYIHAKYIWNKLIKFANFSEGSIQIEVFRIAASFHKKLKKLTIPFDTTKRIEKMILMVNPNSYIYRLCIHLATSTALNPYTEEIILQYIIQFHLFDQNDILDIERILTSKIKKEPLLELKLLLLKIFYNDLLSKCITNLLVKVIERYIDIDGFKDYLLQFLIRSFEFIFNAEKYDSLLMKIENITYFLISFSKLNIEWISQMINSNCSAILALGRCKLFLNSSFSSEKADKTNIIKFKTGIKRSETDLKNFFKCADLFISTTELFDFSKKRVGKIKSIYDYYHQYPFSVLVDYPFI